MDMHWTGKVQSIAFYVGNRGVAWYGILITASMLLALVIAIRRMKRLNTSADQMMTLFLIAIPLAIVAARLGYVVANYKTFFVAPYDWNAFVRTIAIWEGGLTVLWGVPGGVLGGVIWCRMYKKDFWRCADIILPIVLLSQAIGRWGNFFNQELFGHIVTDPTHQWFPLAVFIAADMSWHQATFFYESVLNLLGFVVLSVLYKRVNVKGFGLLGYFGTYTLIRAVLEFFRIEKNNFEDKVNSVQILCFVVAGLCFALITFLCLWKKYHKHERVFYAQGFSLETSQEPANMPEEGASAADAAAQTGTNE